MNTVFRKFMVIAVICLFLGVGVIPHITANIDYISKENLPFRHNKEVLHLGIDSGLVGYWNFDEGNGTMATDSSGNDNHGIIYGTSWTTGICEKALKFDGWNDYVVCDDDSTLDIKTYDLSIITWIKMDSSSNNITGIVSKGAENPTDEGYSFFYYGGADDLRFYISDGDGRKHSTSDSNLGLADNSWHLVAVIVERDSAITFYVDNNAVGSYDISNFSGIDISNSKNLGIGIFSDESQCFNGIIDEVRIYNRTLSFSEIETLYEDPCGTDEAPECEINSPKEGFLYILNDELWYLGRTIIIGPKDGIDVIVEAKDDDGIDEVRIYVDDEDIGRATQIGDSNYYKYEWREKRFGSDRMCILKAKACDLKGDCAFSDEMECKYTNFPDALEILTKLFQIIAFLIDWIEGIIHIILPLS